MINHAFSTFDDIFYESDSTQKSKLGALVSIEKSRVKFGCDECHKVVCKAFIISHGLRTIDPRNYLKWSNKLTLVRGEAHNPFNQEEGSVYYPPSDPNCATNTQKEWLPSFTCIPAYNVNTAPCQSLYMIKLSFLIPANTLVVVVL
jgi:hypothetical protein